MTPLLTQGAFVINLPNANPADGPGGSFRGAAGTVGAASTVLTNSPSTVNQDILYGGPLISIGVADLGQEYTFSYEISTDPAVIANGEFYSSFNTLARFYADTDASGLQFGAGSDFSRRVETFGALATFTAAGSGGFVTVSQTGTVPLVDADGVNPIDSLQFFVRFSTDGAPTADEGGATATIRNIQFEVVPEPSSSLLLALGGLLAVTRRRR